MKAEQVDELEALMAIYEDSISIFIDGIRIDHLEPLRENDGNPVVTCVTVIEPRPSEPAVAAYENEKGKVVCATLEHLPPIMLQATYYSSEYLVTRAAVTWSISSSWLTSKTGPRVEDLQHDLEDLASSMDPSEPVIYLACELMKSKLESVHELVYDQHPDISFLISYNSRRRDELFAKQCHTCDICFELKSGDRFTVLECKHEFCNQCIQLMIESAVAECNFQIKCPKLGCRALLGPHEIRRILDNRTLFDQWTELTLKHAFQTMDDFCWCPRCSSIAVEDFEDNTADCSRCYYVFCTLCMDSRHPGVQCVSMETKLEMLKKKADGGKAEAIAQLRRKEQELKSLNLIEKTTKPCPSCGEGVEKTEGCNKMTCVCGAMFCWRCGDEVEGYDHFNEGGSCVLFDEAEILRWNERMAVLHGAEDPVVGRQEAEDHLLPVPRDQCARCPCCGQLSFKGQQMNNHLRCWSCRRHFCGHCRTLLSKRSKHFSPSGCPQHG
jgi:hypothetical protein